MLGEGQQLVFAGQRAPQLTRLEGSRKAHGFPGLGDGQEGGK